MNGRTKKALAVMMLAAALTAGGVASAWGILKSFWTSDRLFSTGGIDISVRAWTEDDGRREAVDAVTVIDVDDGHVSYIPQVENRAEEAYVRVAISGEAGSEDVDLTEYACGTKEAWKKIGQYMYCTRALEKGDVLDVCDGFSIPDGWDHVEDGDLTVKISAEAIQATAFHPDFSSKEPWGGEKTEAARRDDIRGASHATGDAVSRQDAGIRIAYDKAAGIHVDADDFPGIKGLMPGEVRTGVITVRNDNREDVRVFFKTEWKAGSLGEVMRLRVDNGTIVYSGTAAGGSFAGYRPVADLEAGQEKNIAVMVSLPEEADNRFSFEESCQTWYFAVRDEAVETGDDGDLPWAAALCLVSGSAAVCIVKVRRRSDEHL